MEQGVKIVGDAIVKDLLVKDDYVVGVQYHHRGENKQAHCKLLIDSSGTTGAVRSKLPITLRNNVDMTIKPEHLAVTYREIIKTKEKNPWSKKLYITFSKHIPSPGYFWFFTKGDHCINVGTGYIMSDKSRKGIKQLYSEVMDEYFEEGTYHPIKKGGGLIPVRPPFDCLTFNGGLLTGDAGCLVDPTSAEGHAPALLSGYLAGKVASKAIQADDVSCEGLWEYNTLVMANLGTKHIVSYVGRNILRKMEIEDYDFLLAKKLITTSEMEVLAKTGQIQLSKWSLFRKAVRLWPRYDYLLVLLGFLLKSSKLRKHYEKYPDYPPELDKWIIRRNRILGEVL